MADKKQALCNTCGVPETQWRDGRCWECGRGRYCEMVPSVILEQRVYDWLQKHNISGPTIYPHEVVSSIQSWVRAGRAVPKYVLSYVQEVEKRMSGTRTEG